MPNENETPENDQAIDDTELDDVAGGARPGPRTIPKPAAKIVDVQAPTGSGGGVGGPTDLAAHAVVTLPGTPPIASDER